MNTESFLTLLHIAAVLAVLLCTVRMAVRGKPSMRVVFFGFAMASVLLSDLYWLAYGVLRPGTRMPFAANEVSEWALFLLLGAALTAEPPAARRSAAWEMLMAAAFSAANAALWIAWSGEWVQDICTGAAYGYFLCCLVSRMKQAEVFSAPAWRATGLICLVLIAAQTAIFCVPQGWKRPLDIFCYALLYAGVTALLLLALAALRRGGPGEKAVCLSFAFLAAATAAMYMSAGVWYNVYTFLAILGFPLMLAALKREEERK